MFRQMEDDINYLGKMEEDIIFRGASFKEMEDDLNCLCKWKTS